MRCGRRRPELEALAKRPENLPDVPGRSCASRSAMTCGCRRRSCRSQPNCRGQTGGAAGGSHRSRWCCVASRRSLLVPQRHYPVVSRYIDRTRLVDGHGRGQKLVYLRVGGAAPPLAARLRMRNRCCESSISARGICSCPGCGRRTGGAVRLPLLRQRRGVPGSAGAGDDPPAARQSPRRAAREGRPQPRSADPRHFVLGWDNREKRCCLAAEINKLRERRGATGPAAQGPGAGTERAFALGRRGSRRPQDVVDFAAIDHAAPEREVEALRLEKSDSRRTTTRSVS